MVIPAYNYNLGPVTAQTCWSDRNHCTNWRHGSPFSRGCTLEERVASMKIKNVNEVTDEICACGSWLNHWKKFSGKPVPRFCSVIGCIRRPEVSALIRKDSSSDEDWYITLLCNEHESQIGESLEVSDSTILVPANVTQTCGRDNDRSSVTAVESDARR